MPSRRLFIMVESKPSKGVIYIATGEDFVREAELSAQSVREYLDIPLCLMTDVPELSDAFDEYMTIEDPQFGFEDKINYFPKTPYDRTLYLDTDILVSGSISDIFEVLEEFDICAAYNHNRTSAEATEVPTAFPEINTGVVGYRMNEQVRELFDRWKENYTESDPHDQPSFRTALYKSDIQLAPLTPEYNLMVRYPGHVKDSVKIFHGRLHDFDSSGANQWVNVEDAVNTINAIEGHRVFTHGWNLRVHSDSYIYIIKRSIKEYGMKATLRKGLQKVTGLEDKHLFRNS